MIRRYKFTHSSKSSIFLTADTHFSHSKLVEQRGFKSIKEHDETLINNWNSVVRPQDTVIHCGDFVLGAGMQSKEVCLDLFNKLNGRIVLLWGNHLAGVKSIYRECIKTQFNLDENYEVYPVTWNDKVTFVGNSILTHIKVPNVEKINNKQENYFVYFSHYAHRIWIDCQKGVTSASGHSHGSDKESNKDYLDSCRLDVGVDNFNFTPISFDKYIEIMKYKKQTILDHHDRETSPSF